MYSGILVCLALGAMAAASPYVYKGSRCEYNGQFLPNPHDVCSYSRCDYGEEPWYDEYGNVQFVEIPMYCAYGTSTDAYHFDPYNPCGVTSYACKAPTHYYGHYH